MQFCILSPYVLIAHFYLKKKKKGALCKVPLLSLSLAIQRFSFLDLRRKVLHYF